MTLPDIFSLVDFNYWANHRLRSVLETVPHEQYVRDMGSSHGGIHGTLVHIMGAEEIWLRRWQGTSPSSFYKAEDFPTFDAVQNHWNIVEQELIGFCHMLKTEDDIQKFILYKDLKGNEYSQPLWQSMQHLVNHSTYHRGQVVTMLRQLGMKPIGTELINFYRQKQQ